MEKTILEKRIEERATELFNKEFSVLIKFLNDNKISRQLKITINEKEIPLCNFGQNYGIFNSVMNQNKESAVSNFEKVKESLIKEFIKSETDRVLSSLENINYLFNQ